MDHVMLQTYSLTWWQNIVKNLFHKAQEEGKDLYQCLMMYRNTPLSSTLQSPMQILTNRAARSSLPMSNAARRQKGLGCKGIESSSQEWTLNHTWSSHRSECHVFESCQQKMVSSHNYKPLSRASKLYNQNRRWHYILKNTKPSETVSTKYR